MTALLDDVLLDGRASGSGENEVCADILAVVACSRDAVAHNGASVTRRNHDARGVEYPQNRDPRAVRARHESGTHGHGERLSSASLNAAIHSVDRGTSGMLRFERGAELAESGLGRGNRRGLRGGNQRGQCRGNDSRQQRRQRRRGRGRMDSGLRRRRRARIFRGIKCHDARGRACNRQQPRATRASEAAFAHNVLLCRCPWWRSKLHLSTCVASGGIYTRSRGQIARACVIVYHLDTSQCKDAEGRDPRAGGLGKIGPTQRGSDGLPRSRHNAARRKARSISVGSIC